MVGKKGRSGRRPSPLTQQQARHALTNLTRRSVAVLEAALESSDRTLALKAATYVLDQGMGRPPQRLEHTGENGGPMRSELVFREITVDEAKRRGQSA